MKKNVLIVFCLLSLPLSRAVAQGYEGKGDVMLNLGVGFWGDRGRYFDYLGSKVELAAFISSLEFGVHEYVSVGGYLTWQHRSFNGWGTIDNIYGPRDWTVRETWTNFGVKTAFHFTSFLNDRAHTAIPEQLDLYAGVLIGMSIYHKARIDHYSGNKFPVTSATPSIGLLAAGARYYFTPNVGAFLEIMPWWYGDMNVIGTGFTFKF